jgi:CRISPR-associated exonuclease Cas4
MRTVMATISSNPLYGEDELLPLSGLRHMAVCERQFALVHIEQSWADNLYTAEGSLLHKNVDTPHYETRRGRRLVHALPLTSRRLGLAGKADLVEFPTGPGGEPPIPIEYKRGHPKPDDVDEVQVCAQALCLEEMLGCSISRAFLYYHQVRHRCEVPLSDKLRIRVETLASRMHELFLSGKTPKMDRMPKCRSCSLDELCKPQWTGAGSRAWERWKAFIPKAGQA